MSSSAPSESRKSTSSSASSSKRRSSRRKSSSRKMTSTHGKPSEDMCCMATMDDITEEEKNYCEYLTMPSKTWHASGFSGPIVRDMLHGQFATYLANVEKASNDCAAAVRRLVAKGPPLYIEDKHALPLPDGDTHVEMLWFADDDQEISAKLVGALEGAERDALWAGQKETLAAMEAAEKDDGSDE